MLNYLHDPLLESLRLFGNDVRQWLLEIGQQRRQRLMRLRQVNQALIRRRYVRSKP